MEFHRPSWDKYFITIAQLTSERSNCIKRRVGCILVKDYRILSLGYNGTPKGTQNCFEGGCLRCSNTVVPGTHLDLCMCLHAEENAILFLSKSELCGSVMYVTLMPCISCVKKIIQCGIAKVIYLESYCNEIDIKSKDILEKSGIVIEQWNQTLI
jgi:dCMP deaminase